MISKEEFILWHTLHRISDEITRYEENVFKKTKVTHQQYKILLSVALFEELNRTQAKITDIAPIENRSFVSVSLITDRMVDNGLIKKIRDKTDRRVVNLKITRKGKQVLKEASKPTTVLVNKLFALHSEEEKKIGSVFMTKILDALGLDFQVNEQNIGVIVDKLNELSNF